ncbi:MAG: tripartite tricarboxylate transporter substrate binding protein [Polaromonas sp.]|nr:tripartite tricarboxylate transporter substrate binding protein [Polaromonas sp.]
MTADNTHGAAGSVGLTRRQAAIGLIAAATGAPALAQGNNGQAINLIVPLAPGGIADITARPFAIPLARELNQPVVVENRIGAGGAVGMSYASKQKPDGNTLLMALSSIVIIPEADKVMGRPPSYTLSQFTPIALVSADPTVLVVRANSPWKTTADLIRDAKAKPKTLSYSSSGIYGTTHVAQAMLWQSAGVDMLHVPYNGGGPSMTALLGGQVDITAQAPGTVAAHVKAGTVRVLGTWGAERLKSWPDVPTFKEQGFDVEFYIWSGLFAPAGLPPAKLAQLRTAAKRSTQDPGFVAAMTTMNTPIRYMEGAELDRFLEQDQKRLAVVIKAMGRLE